VLVSVPFPGREVKLQIWTAQVGRVPLYLLDSNIPENTPEDQRITRQLYGGDKETRIQHEIVLGIGGMRALRLLGINPDVCHINEGHAAFLMLERIRQIMTERKLDFETAREVISASSIFTTHTPVAAGFDIFDPQLLRRYFESYAAELGISFDTLARLGRTNPDDAGQPFNMALFAVRNSTFRNAVSRLHGEVSRSMWEGEWKGYPEAEVPVESITNGIHTRSWISPEMFELFRRYLGPGWSDNPVDMSVWQRVGEIPDEELWRSHMAAKERLVNFARGRVAQQMRGRGAPSKEIEEARKILNPEVLTIGFARRFASYKRATLILRDLERVKRIIHSADMPVQLIFAGKAHPADSAGKELVKQLANFARGADMRNSVAFIENYDMNVASYLVQGVDVWLNTPRRPLEASGTSGMKAAANGILNLSILDGWWDEGFNNDVGWAIGHGEMYDDPEYQDDVEANALYQLLEREVVPLYYKRSGNAFPADWAAKMKTAMMQLLPVFNTNRMVGEYVDRFYIPAAARSGDFLRGDLRRVKDLVAWKQFVIQHWSEVRIESVEQGKLNDLHVGSEVSVRVKLQLGSLKPDQVSVELYHGLASVDREVKDGNTTALKKAGQEGGSWWYEGVVPCAESGLYGYAVRVRPVHADALVPNEINLIAWY
jgi:starch phosphorylase